MSNHYSSDNGRKLARLWAEYYQTIYPKVVTSTRAEMLTLLSENFLITDNNIQLKDVDIDLVKMM